MSDYDRMITREPTRILPAGGGGAGNTKTMPQDPVEALAQDLIQIRRDLLTAKQELDAAEEDLEKAKEMYRNAGDRLARFEADQVNTVRKMGEYMGMMDGGTTP